MVEFVLPESTGIISAISPAPTGVCRARSKRSFIDCIQPFSAAELSLKLWSPPMGFSSMAWGTESADAFVAEVGSELSSGSRRRNKCPEYIQLLCTEAENFGPLGRHGPCSSGVALAASVALHSLVDVMFAISICGVSGIGVPLDGSNGAARAEVTRRSVAVTREKERIFLALLVNK